MKKPISMLVTIVLVLLLTTPVSLVAAQSNLPVILTVSSFQGDVGAVIPITISISGQTGIGGLELELPISTEYLELTTILDEDGQQMDFQIGTVAENPAVSIMGSRTITTLSDGDRGIKVALVTYDALQTEGELITFYFKMLKDVPKDGVKIDCRVVEVVSIEGKAIYDVTSVPGYVTNSPVKQVVNQIEILIVQSFDDKAAVEAARAAYEALTEDQKALVTNYQTLLDAEAAIAELEKPNVTYGDLNGDDKVTAADALEVLKSVVGKVALTDDQLTAADTDGNGKADAADALNILKKVVGKIQKFPVEE